MKTIHITQGLDLRLAGAPDQNGVPENKDVWHVSITGGDYVGMKPTICVEEGDRVFAGQLLFFDKKNPGVKFVAPGAGVVQELHRGERRVFQSLDIKLDSGDDFLLSVPYEKTPADKLLSLSDKETRARLVDSGLWIALRTRPFSRIPKVDATPVALFVNAADTNPHAPNPQKIIDARSDDFVNGLRVLSRICGKRMWICLGAQEYEADFIAELEKIPSAQVARFTGKHPSGLVGTHIAKLDPCGLGRVVWTIGYQDVIAIGELFVKGRYPSQRVVSLSGPMVKNPRLIKICHCANLLEVCEGELKSGPARIVSGSVLNGRAVVKRIPGAGRYVNQISVVSDEDAREFFGWLAPGFDKFSASPLVGGSFLKKTFFNITTALHGGPRAVFPNPLFYKLLPLDIEPTVLFKALEIGDLETCEKLGAFELDEEDLALCTLVDLGKNDFGQTLRALLDKAMKEEE